MAATASERDKSRSYAGGRITTLWVVEGTSDLGDAQAAVLAAAPSTLETRNRDDKSLRFDEPVWVDSGADDGLWLASIDYGLDGTFLTSGQQSVIWSTKGGSQHIVASKQINGWYPPAGPYTYNMVGATKDAVEGCDIIVPVFSFTVRKVVSTKPSPSTIYGLTGKVNSGSFTATDTRSGNAITLAAGECLFKGADAGEPRKEDAAVEITYEFAGSPNVTGLQIGSITGIAKKGWEVIDVFTEAVVMGTGADAVLVRKPKYIYVHQVYETASFSGLGIS